MGNIPIRRVDLYIQLRELSESVGVLDRFDTEIYRIDRGNLEEAAEALLQSCNVWSDDGSKPRVFQELSDVFPKYLIAKKCLN